MRTLVARILAVVLYVVCEAAEAVGCLSEGARVMRYDYWAEKREARASEAV